MKTKLTKTEKETVLEVLFSAEDMGFYVDNGDFLCNLPTKKHVRCIKNSL